MNTTCTADFTIFEYPQFQATAMHIITVIVTPFHLLGLYCIVYKTPDQMKGVKWYLLNLHLTVMAFDYTLTFLTVPFFLATKLAGFSMGIVKYLDLPFVIPALFLIYCFGLMFIAIVAIFQNRFQVICTFSWMPKWRKHVQPSFLPKIYIIHACQLVTVFFFVPDQELARKDLFKNLPCLPREIYKAPIYVIADNMTYHLTVMMAGVILVSSYILFFLTCLILNSLKQRRENKMSEKTIRLQKQFLIAIVVQSGVPLLVFMIPIAYYVIALLNEYYIQGTTNFMLVIESLHGLFSTLAMLFFHKPYRKAVTEMFVKVIERKHKVSQVYLVTRRSGS